MRSRRCSSARALMHGRLPRWAFWLVQQSCRRPDRPRSDRPRSITIGTVVTLKCRAEDVKLHLIEDQVRRWIPKGGAL